MGELVSADKNLKVVIDGGNRVEIVSGLTAEIDGHGYLHIYGSDGRSVAVFAKFDSVIVEPQAKTE